MKNAIFVTLGLFFFTLGAIGAVLPVLPTTPFLLLAAACFAKGSKRFEHWFTGTKLYKKYLDSYVRERAMTLATKIKLCAIATTMLAIAFFVMQNVFGRVIIVLLIVIKYFFFIFRIRTIKSGEKTSSSVSENGDET